MGQSQRRLPAEGLRRLPDSFLREVCCLPRGLIKDVNRKLSALVWVLDFYPLLIFQVASDKFVTRISSAIKRGFRGLGQQVKGSGAQAVFSSIFPAAGNDEGRNRKSQEINSWLQAWSWAEFWDF